MQRKTESELSAHYSKDGLLKAIVVDCSDCFYVDFYKDEVMVDSRRIEGKSLRYAEDMAENFVEGIIRIDPKTWRLHGV